LDNAFLQLCINIIVSNKTEQARVNPYAEKMTAAASGKKIGSDSFLISFSPVLYGRTGEIKVNPLTSTDKRLSSSCTLKYKGNRTPQLDIELNNLLQNDFKACNEAQLPVVSLTHGPCVLMTPIKLQNGYWSWITSFKCSYPTRCSDDEVCLSNYCANRSATFQFEFAVHFSTPCSILGEGEKNVLAHLSQLLEDQTLSDVTFQVQGESIKAHSILVAAGSPVLAAMFQQDFIEKRTRDVKIQDTKAKVFKQLLRYIYTGKAPEIGNEDIARDLLVAADKYAVECLKEECIEILIMKLSVGNAIPILILAHLHSAPKLLQTTLSFMSLNGKAVCLRSMEWGQLMKNYPDLCYTATKYIVGC